VNSTFAVDCNDLYQLDNLALSAEWVYKKGPRKSISETEDAKLAELEDRR
jgi:hypothetical protein